MQNRMCVLVCLNSLNERAVILWQLPYWHKHAHGLCVYIYFLAVVLFLMCDYNKNNFSKVLKKLHTTGGFQGVTINGFYFSIPVECVPPNDWGKMMVPIYPLHSQRVMINTAYPNEIYREWCAWVRGARFSSHLTFTNWPKCKHMLWWKQLDLCINGHFSAAYIV